MRRPFFFFFVKNTCHPVCEKTNDVWLVFSCVGFRKSACGNLLGGRLRYGLGGNDADHFTGLDAGAVQLRQQLFTVLLESFRMNILFDDAFGRMPEPKHGFQKGIVDRNRTNGGNEAIDPIEAVVDRQLFACIVTRRNEFPHVVRIDEQRHVPSVGSHLRGGLVQRRGLGLDAENALGSRDRVEFLRRPHVVRRHLEPKLLRVQPVLTVVAVRELDDPTVAVSYRSVVLDATILQILDEFSLRVPA